MSLCRSLLQQNAITGPVKSGEFKGKEVSTEPVWQSGLQAVPMTDKGSRKSHHVMVTERTAELGMTTSNWVPLTQNTEKWPDNLNS